jgi:hypothetical protein
MFDLDGFIRVGVYISILIAIWWLIDGWRVPSEWANS